MGKLNPNPNRSYNIVIDENGESVCECKGCGQRYKDYKGVRVHTGSCKKWQAIKPKRQKPRYITEEDTVEPNCTSANKVTHPSGEVEYSCTICGRLFPTVSSVRAHHSASKNCKEGPTESKPPKSCEEVKLADGTTIYRCKGCGKEYKNAVSCSRHAATCKSYVGEEAYNKRSQLLKEINQSEEARQKAIQTNLERYGVKYSMQSEEVRRKSKETCLKRYGAENPSNLEICKKKREQTFLERFGVSSPLKSKGVRDKISKTCMERYGVPHAIMSEYAQSRNGTLISKPNRDLAELFKRYGIETSFEHHISHYSFDLYVNDHLLVEVDPTYTHNSTVAAYFGGSKRKLPKDPSYHYNKSTLAEENGFHCIHVFDWDDLELIARIFSPKLHKIYARDCQVRHIDHNEANEFISTYHLQGALKHRKSTIYLGLHHDNRLVAVMTLGTPRYNKNYEYELLRVCTHPDYQITGGNQKLFKYFIKKYHPTSIISYCDRAKFRGKIYDKLGFRKLRTTKPTKHWYNYENHFTDNLVRTLGADKLIGTNYGKGTDNDLVMISEGYVEMYDCGQVVYEWKS